MKTKRTPAGTFIEEKRMCGCCQTLSFHMETGNRILKMKKLILEKRKNEGNQYGKIT